MKFDADFYKSINPLTKICFIIGGFLIDLGMRIAGYTDGDMKTEVKK